MPVRHNERTCLFVVGGRDGLGVSVVSRAGRNLSFSSFSLIPLASSPTVRTTTPAACTHRHSPRRAPPAKHDTTTPNPAPTPLEKKRRRNQTHPSNKTAQNRRVPRYANHAPRRTRHVRPPGPTPLPSPGSASFSKSSTAPATPVCVGMPCRPAAATASSSYSGGMSPSPEPGAVEPGCLGRMRRVSTVGFFCGGGAGIFFFFWICSRRR